MNPEQAIPWRTRADLLAVENAAHSGIHFTIKDPIKDEFYHFSQVEHFILERLNSPHSFASLISAASAELGRKLGVQEIQNYLRHLARDNLIVPDALGDGERLFKQRNHEASGNWKRRILGLLSIKLPGFHPGGILPPLKFIGWLCFNPISIIAFAIAVVTTILFALFSFQTLAGKIPMWSELMTPGHVTAVLTGFVLAKILHELCHAIACQRTGHECSEMGVLLLVFLPCLYCDVSDMWTEKSKWKRILVSLAGVYVEICMALICFWIWFFTVPGALHNFAYSLMLITSINTLFINGNPLMRYDGYYALADWVGIPNLGMESGKLLNKRVQSFFLRRTPVFEFKRMTTFLLTYSVGAFFYRWFIMFAIGTAIWTFFDFQQLRSIGNVVVGAIALIAMVPMALAARKSTAAVFKHGLRWINTSIVVALVAGAIYLFLGLEFSHRIWGQAEIQLSNAHYVFAFSDGKFDSNVVDGQLVEVDDSIGTIHNKRLAMEKISLESQLLEAQMSLNLISMRTDSAGLAGKTEYWKKRVKTLERQLEENQLEQNNLQVLAPVAGRIVAFQHQPPVDRSDTTWQSGLPKKSGTLFDPQNKDSQVDRGEPLCYIGQSDRMKGSIAVDEKDIELVEVGQQVKIAMPFGGAPVLAEVVNVALEQDDDSLGSNSAASSAINTPAPINQVTYRVEVEFEAVEQIRIGSIQNAVIICQPTNMTKFIGRWLRNSFWF